MNIESTIDINNVSKRGLCGWLVGLTTSSPSSFCTLCGEYLSLECDVSKRQD